MDSFVDFIVTIDSMDIQIQYFWNLFINLLWGIFELYFNKILFVDFIKFLDFPNL